MKILKKGKYETQVEVKLLKKEYQTKEKTKMKDKKRWEYCVPLSYLELNIIALARDVHTVGNDRHLAEECQLVLREKTWTLRMSYYWSRWGGWWWVGLPLASSSRKSLRINFLKPQSFPWTNLKSKSWKYNYNCFCWCCHLYARWLSIALVSSLLALRMLNLNLARTSLLLQETSRR